VASAPVSCQPSNAPVGRGSGLRGHFSFAAAEKNLSVVTCHNSIGQSRDSTYAT